jgi:hypothetical protein
MESSDREALKFKELEHILIEKVDQNMLQASARKIAQLAPLRDSLTPARHTQPIECSTKPEKTCRARIMRRELFENATPRLPADFASSKPKPYARAGKPSLSASLHGFVQQPPHR